MSVSTALADRYLETVVVNDAEYTGIIKSQNPQDRIIEVDAEYYKRSISKNRLNDYTIIKAKKRLSTLSSSARQWYANHFGTSSSSEDVMVNTITLKTVKPDGRKVVDTQDAILLEDGMMTTFVGFKKQFKIPTDKITSIRYTLRDADATTGIIDVLATDQGEITGQLLEQTPGESFRIQRTADDTPYSISFDEVNSYSKRQLDSTRGILEQAPTIDVVVTKAGCITGYIISRDYVNGQIVVLSNDGSQHTVANEDVIRIESSHRDHSVVATPVATMPTAAQQADTAPQQKPVTSSTTVKPAAQPAVESAVDPAAQPATSAVAQQPAAEPTTTVGVSPAPGTRSAASAADAESANFIIGGVALQPCCANVVKGNIWAVEEEMPVEVSGDRNGYVSLLVPATPVNEDLCVYELTARVMGGHDYAYTFSTSDTTLRRVKVSSTEPVPSGMKRYSYRLNTKTSYVIYRPSDQLVVWFRTK